MAGGAERRGLPTATLLGLLALLAGPVAAVEGDGLTIETQLYITAGLLGGLALVLTIAVVYLLLTLNRIQSDVLSLKDTVSKQKQQQQPPTTKRVDDVKNPENKPTEIQLQPVSQPPPASQQQSQPMSQMQSQSISQQQSRYTSQPQSQPMPQSQPGPQQQLNDPRNSSYQQQSSYQPATSPGNTSGPTRQQTYGGVPQRPGTAVPHGALRREPSYGGAPVAAYGFPAQAPQSSTTLPQQQLQSTRSGYDNFGAQLPSRPAPKNGSRGPSSPNAYANSGSVYPLDRY